MINGTPTLCGKLSSETTRPASMVSPKPVVGDEQIRARQLERLLQRCPLLRLQLEARTGGPRTSMRSVAVTAFHFSACR